MPARSIEAGVDKKIKSHSKMTARRIKMKTRAGRRKGFSIVELLTVMSIIVLLMSILLPAFNKMKRYAKNVKQMTQFKSIDGAMELYNAKWDGYPESSYDPVSGDGGLGAVVLSDNMLGRDLLGYTPNVADYNNTADTSGRETYLEIENANAYMIKCIYGVDTMTYKNRNVLCDIYTTVSYFNPNDNTDRMNGRKVGMPILYFKANTAGTTHPVDETQTSSAGYDNGVEPDDSTNIYNHADNAAIVSLGVPNTTLKHPMDETTAGTFGSPAKQCSPYYFYNEIWNNKVTSSDRPNKAETYILMSAGFDGLYGTKDDIFNFGN